MARRRSPGEGSIHQRKDTGRWRAAVVVGYTPNGNPKRVTRDFDSKREAADWLAEQSRKLARGELNLSEITLGEFLADWLAMKRQEVRDNTYQRYHAVVHKLIVPGLGQVKVRELKPTHIARWIADLQRAGKSTYSVFRAHEFLSMALNHALNLELIFRNPAHKIRPPKPPPPKLDSLSAAEVQTFLAWCQTHGERYGGRHKGKAIKRREGPHKVYRYAYVALMTGMRREELLGLRWQDVNLEEGALEIHQSVVFIGGKAVFDNPKTQESEREVMLDAGTVAILRDQQQHVAEMRAAAGASWREHDLVFPSIVGTPLPERTLRRWWEDAIEGSGVNPIRLYDTRATWITHALNRGMNPKTVAKRVGHKDIAFMLKTYARPDKAEMRAAARGLDELYGPPPLKLVHPEEPASPERKAE